MTTGVPGLGLSMLGQDLPVGLVWTLLLLSTCPCLCRPSSRDSAPSNSSSFFWRVNTNPPSYLFGTIHVPYTRVWDAVPDVVKVAFRRADHLFIEVDLSDSDTLHALSTCQLLPDGKHLSQVLPEDLFIRLKLHMEQVRRAIPSWLSSDQKSRGLTADYLFSTLTANWQRKRPVWAMVLVNSLTRSDVSSRGAPVLDLFLSRWARSRGKRVSAIENVEEQCQAINGMNHEEVVFALNQTLVHYHNLLLGISPASSSAPAQTAWSVTTDDLVEQYRRGNLDPKYFAQDTFQVSFLGDSASLDARQRKLARQVDDYFREHLIERRNRRMAARIVDLLVNRPSGYFFALGAGHFVGERESVLELVRSAGFDVEMITPWQGSSSHRLPPPHRNKIQGTFDDLPDEEKTKALLQFLQYKQQLEEEESQLSHKSSTGAKPGKVPQSESDDERAVEGSLKVWYGYGLFSNKAFMARGANSVTWLFLVLVIAATFIRTP